MNDRLSHFDSTWRDLADQLQDLLETTATGQARRTL